MIDGTNATNETKNYGYPQFVAEDKPGWLTDWNKTMEAIDANEAGIQTQVTENKEDLEALEMTVERHEKELNGENGAFQRIADNQNRIQDLETKVGDDEHGLVKDMNDVKRDLTETNTMAVKTNGAVNSIRDLICNPFVSTSQYNAGAYVYLQDADDGEIHYYKCNTTHRGAFNPDHFDDVTEKLITALDNSGGGSGSQYVLPVAGSADDVDPLLGGVIIGDGLVIDPETGVLSTEGGGGGGGDVPYASKLQAGIMKPGNGLSDGHDNGTVDVLVDNDTIVINQETGRLEAHKQFTPQDLPVATDNTVGVVKGKSSLNNNEGKVNIANDGAMSVAIDNDYIKRKSDGSLTVNPDKIGSASGINVGEGLEKPDSDTIALKRGTPSQLGGWKPDARDFYKENDKDMVQLKPNGGLEHTSEGLAVVGGGGGGGTTYSEGNGIDITNDEISVKIKQNGGLAFDNGELYATGGGGSGSSVLINPTLIAGYRSDEDPRAYSGSGVYLETAQDIAAYNNLGYHIPTSAYYLHVVNEQPDINDPSTWSYMPYYLSPGVTYCLHVNRTTVAPEEGEEDYPRYDVKFDNESYDGDISSIKVVEGKIPKPLQGYATDKWDLHVGNGINGIRDFCNSNPYVITPDHPVTLYKATPGIPDWVRQNELVTLKPHSVYHLYYRSDETILAVQEFKGYTSEDVINFMSHTDIPYINILDNGVTRDNDNNIIIGYGTEAKNTLNVPYECRGRKCMLFFPYSLKVPDNGVANNPFNNTSWTGYFTTVSYTLAYANMYGDAATVGTYVPFYHRDFMIGSDNFSFVQAGNTITIRDWLADTFGTSDPVAGEVKQPYGSVIVDCSDALQIALFVTVRRCEVAQGSGTVETYTTRHGVTGGTIIEPEGDLVLVPIDNQ